MVNFWGGVYKSFLLPGPGEYTVNIARNHSLNTICSAILIDRVSGPPTALDRMNLPWMADVRYEPPVVSEMDRGASFGPNNSVWTQAMESFNLAEDSIAQRRSRLSFYRFGVANGAPPALLENWRWRLDLWDAEERQEFESVMSGAWARMQEFNPSLRDPHWRPYSPGIADDDVN